ncbi:MAG: DUF4838 domain-containing protein [Chitinophagales bacterium]|nr:DUF4838 domain-containing protein [Chitinophagales bacterium]
MSYKKISTCLLIISLLSACQIIRENREKKNLEDTVYTRVFEEDYNDSVTDAGLISQNPTSQAIESTTARQLLNRNEVWYHPNPWWRIETDTFEVAKPNVQHINFSPDYGFSSYIDPNTNQVESEGWNVWKGMNKFTKLNNPTTHNWQGFVNTYKDIFQQHPEYLAEIDGRRLGYGKTTKLCVSNVNMQKLYIQYTKDRILKNPGLDIFSVEPSDGAGFCTCEKCTKIGNVSNQVFYLANIVAKGIKKEYPNKYVGLLAYYTHAEVPTFDLEKNVFVALAPSGFQTIYNRPLGLFDAWHKKHKELGLYSYLNIPQWASEQPRLGSKGFLKEIKLPLKIDSKFVIYESGTNINTVLFASLISKLLKNPTLSWNEIYTKFLNDCFPNTKVSMDRLFKRWFNGSWANGGNEINYSIYDIDEAFSNAKDYNEQQRIRDLKAYVNYLVVYEDFSKDKNNTNLIKTYFDFLYNTSNRNIVNVRALTQYFEKYFKDDVALKSRYQYNNSKDKNWIKYTNDKEIDKTFEKNKTKYPPIKVDFLIKEDIENLFVKNQQSIKSLQYFELPIKNDACFFLFNKSNSITIKPIYTLKDSKTIISIEGENNDFFVQKFLENNEEWKINLPVNTLYKITQNRIATATLSISGDFTPLVLTSTKDMIKNYDAYKFNQKRQLEKIAFTDRILDAYPAYIVMPKN